MNFKEIIVTRRDTRHFTSAIVPEPVIERALEAAHHAPSVGLSQPWRFVFIESVELRKKIYQNFSKEREKAESIAAKDASLSPEKLAIHRNLKLEAILEAPKGMIVFCEAPPDNSYTIGTTSQKLTFSWSVACAIQNFWLSLTSDKFSMGWVSILNYPELNSDLEVPQHWEPLGYFCIGQPADDYKGKPMLESTGWKSKQESPTVIYR